jgi:microcystin-dependent protein
MKPLNLDNSPCSPISSNCVIWSGNDIPCIKLCKGDTISDVVFKLATELCTIMDELNVSNYDLACLNLGGCDPKDFQALIQLLITKICELENLPNPTPSPDGGGCPDNCIVAVADCLGGGTDTLTNYVNTIATKVCDLVANITLLQGQIDTLNITVVDLQDQINNIPVYTLPDVTSTCPIDGNTTARLDIMFEGLLSDWCDFIAATGTASEIAASITPTCTLTDIISEPGWISPIGTLADAINNIWVSICYFYNKPVPTTEVTGSSGITVTSSTVGSVTTYDVSLTSPLSTLMPTGAVMPWAGTSGTAPAGWLFCDGTIYDGADPAYNALFTVIGTAYGAAPVGFFAVPNMANSIPVGIGTNSDGYDLTTVGNFGGDKAIALSAAEVAPHTHNVAGTTSGTFVDLITASTDGTTGDPAADPRTGDYTRLKVGADGNLQQDDHAQQFSAHTHTFSAATDTGTGVTGSAHGNMQPYVVMQYIIKL